jgi:hypothetical protein
MGACKCENTLGNTGTPTCESIASVTKKLIFVPYYDEDGNINKIDTSATLDQTWLDALLNHADSDKRWYPTPEIKNVSDERGEPKYEEFGDGTKVLIQDGARAFKALFVGVSSTFLSKISDNRCADLGVYHIDKNGNLIGTEIVDGYLYPTRIEKSSYLAKLIKAQDGAVQKVELSFEYHGDEDDADLRMIKASEFASGVRMLLTTGLMDVTAVITSPTTTGFVATLNTDYGSVANKIKANGWVAADFVLYNETDSLSVAITSVTETSDGVYTFVIPAQTSGDVLRLSKAAAKKKYDLSNATVTIP